MHSRNEPEVQRILRRHAGASRELGWIDLADDIRKLRPWRQSFRVSLAARPPFDANTFRRHARDEILAGPRDWLERIFMDRRSWDIEVGELVIEKTSERAHQSRLRLSL